jgi:hypothetical protein
MMSGKRRELAERVAGLIGLGLGLTVVVFAVAGWRVPGGSGQPGADLFFSTNPTGELAVSPAGPFLRATGLFPGGEAHGAIQLRNQTGTWLDVRVRALPDRLDLGGVLFVQVRSGPVTLFQGRLRDLGFGSPRPLALAPGARAQLRFRAWLPASLKVGYQGRFASVPFELQAEPAG